MSNVGSGFFLKSLQLFFEAFDLVRDAVHADIRRSLASEATMYPRPNSTTMKYRICTI